jgi:hypothetical protein
MNAIGERRYRDALTSLDEGISQQLASPNEVDAEEFLKRFRTLLAYVDSCLDKDFGEQWETQPYEEDQALIRCSFCGKTEPEVDKIIAGPDVFICNECIVICADALTKE